MVDDEEPTKNKIETYLPTNIDQVDNCKDKHINCPVCGYVGHIVRHLNSERIDYERNEIEIKIGVNHAHFILDKKTKESRIAEGRNITHYFKQKMVSIPDFCFVTYRLKSNKKLPPWLRKRLNDEYGL